MKQLLTLLTLFLISTVTSAHPNDDMSVEHIGTGTIIKINSPINVTPNSKYIPLNGGDGEHIYIPNCYLVPDQVEPYDRFFSGTFMIQKVETVTIGKADEIVYLISLARMIEGKQQKTQVKAKIRCVKYTKIRNFKEHFSEMILAEPRELE